VTCNGKCTYVYWDFKALVDPKTVNVTTGADAASCAVTDTQESKGKEILEATAKSWCSDNGGYDKTCGTDCLCNALTLPAKPVGDFTMLLPTADWEQTTTVSIPGAPDKTVKCKYQSSGKFLATKMRHKGECYRDPKKPVKVGMMVMPGPDVVVFTDQPEPTEVTELEPVDYEAAYREIEAVIARRRPELG
jgi:hypothetical protein